MIDQDSTKTSRLIADIGGTNARFALLTAEGNIEKMESLDCSRFPNIVAAVQHYLSLVGNPAVRNAAMAIANPIEGDIIRMTNHSWSFSIKEAAQELGLDTLVFKNDFTALAYSVPHLSGSEVRKICGDKPEPQTAIAVIGPGTGLGVSGLVWSGDQWVAIAGEGGHVSVSPDNERESAIVDICRRKFGHVSGERLVSGMGLQNLYDAICELDGAEVEPVLPADITARALNQSDSRCIEAVDVFCSILGSITGNLALTLGAKSGVYIGGGIVPRLGEFFDQSDFVRRFQAKGRFRSYLEKIPVYVIEAKNPALIGISTVF